MSASAMNPASTTLSQTRLQRLPNGMHIATVRLPHVSRSHVCIMLRGGPVCEDDESWGLSHVLEHMVFRGTRSYPDSRAVNLAADCFGGEIGGATYRDRVVFDTRVDPGSEEAALLLLNEMLRFPRFEGFDIEKDVLREELFEMVDDDGQEVDPDNLALRRLFNGHVLARSIEGTLATLENFDERTTRDFHRQSYGPEHTVVAIAGPISHRSVQDAAKCIFGSWSLGTGARTGRAPRKMASKRRADVVRTDISQTSVRICFPCDGLMGRDRYPLAMLSRILDDGPASRFQSNLIDSEGLAYALWCAVDLFEERGLIEIGAQVQHDRVGKVVEAICQELRRVRHKKPMSDELARVAARVRRDFRDMRDDPSLMADAVGRGVMVGLPFVPDAIETQMRELRPKHIAHVAQRVFTPANAVLAMVGRPPRREIVRAETALATLAE